MKGRLGPASLRVACVVSAALGWCVPAAALQGTSCPTPLLANGSFEAGPAVPAGSSISLPVGSSALPGWIVIDDAVDYVDTYWEAYEGARSVDLNGSGPGGLKRTLATVPGATYVLTFFLAGDPTCGPPIKSVKVSTPTEGAVFDFDTSGASLADMRWEAHVWSFTASAPQTPLVFRSLTPGACGPVVDMVHVFLLPPGAPVARVSVKRVVGPAGTPDPHWTDANVENMVAEASAIHGTATGTTFLLEEIVDLVDPRLPATWFAMNLASGNLGGFESAAENDPCAYEWRTDAINVYVVSTLLSP